MNLTQGNSNYVTVKNGTTFSNCIAPVAQVAQLQGLINAGILPAIAMTGAPGTSAIGICQGAFATGGPLAGIVTVNPLAGVPAQIGGNELPNSPHWTAAVGAQYHWDLGGDWGITPRADFYYQAKSYARIFNAVERPAGIFHTNHQPAADPQPEVEVNGPGLRQECCQQHGGHRSIPDRRHLRPVLQTIFPTEPRTMVFVSKQFLTRY